MLPAEETGGVSMNFLLVGLGASIGAMSRYGINRFFEKRPHPFPKATLLINLTGAFILGVLVGLKIDSQLYLLLGTGVMGGYTTFSTFNFELLTLYQKHRSYFYWYFGITYGCGLLLSFLGLLVGQGL